MDAPPGPESLVDKIYDYFEFYPSKAVAIVALALFALASLGILAQTIRSRAWFMLIAVVVGLLEAGGFACCIAMLSHPIRGVYIIMQCLLIIPPSFLALVDYIVLGRLVRAIQQVRTEVAGFQLKPKLIIWAFFAAEIGSLAAQGAGAGLSVSGDDNEPPPAAGAGRVLLIVGLAALVILIGFFLLTTIYVQLNPQFHVPEAPTIRTVFLGIYVTTALLLARNIFRVIEFSFGFYGKISRAERWMYIFDSLLIVLWLFIMIPLHFGVYLKRAQREVDALAFGRKADPAMAHNVIANGQGKATEMV